MRRARSGSAGFTLFEILLALGVLSILVALAWPSVLRMYGEQKIIGAAEKVRSLMAAARVHAIESGLVYQFRYEPKGNHFLVVPFEREFEGADPNARTTGADSGVGRFSKLGGNLEEGITFSATRAPKSDATTNPGQQISSEVLEGLPNADKLSGVSWSGPLLFQPDGSSADTELNLIDRHSQRVTLRVRGITGAVSVGRLQAGDQP